MTTFKTLILEGTFKFKDKTQLIKDASAKANYNKIVNYDEDGSWSIDDKADANRTAIRVMELSDYYSWDYNVKTSVKVALTDLEKGKYEEGEVENR